MEDKEKELPPTKVEIGVYWYEDENGKIVFDIEEMENELKTKIAIIEVMCNTQ